MWGMRQQDAPFLVLEVTAIFCLICISWLQGDALYLPFSDETFDAVTVGYGLRNVADIPRALREICRVLKLGLHSVSLCRGQC